MGVTRVRFLLKLWQRSSMNLGNPAAPSARNKETGSWPMPRTNTPPRSEPTRPEPRPPE
jgi:hypothetical protein